MKLVLSDFKKYSSVETNCKGIHNSLCKLEKLATYKNDWNNLIRGMILSRTTNMQYDDLTPDQY